MTRFILAIDQGTTNSKVSLFDEGGALAREASRPLDIKYPQPGWVEQDPWALWRSVLEAAGEVLDGIDPQAITCAAVANQRESVLLWDRRTGEPLGPCVTWQCRRSASLCSELRRQGFAQLAYERTGLALDPMFSAGKARWLLDQIPAGRQRAENGEICLGTVDAWILWNLTGGKNHACDMTNASRTQLFNLHTLSWDEDLLTVFGLPRPMLPEVHLSSDLYGYTTAAGAIPASIPITAMIGDSHGALFGHAGFQPGSIKATYGTGSSLMTPTSTPIFSRFGLSTSIAWGYEQAAYCLEGNIYATGAAVQWAAQLLQVEGPTAIDRLARSVADNDGVYFVPALTGLGAPHWKDDATGLLTGLRRSTMPAHVARAAIESIAFQIRDVFEAMQSEAGDLLRQLLADGGASSNDLLMQFQSDILGVPVLRSCVSDVSALGAAYLAGLTVGLWASLDEIAALPRPHDRFEPQMPTNRRTALCAGWRQAVARTVLECGQMNSER
jgi:glycerol kinase